MVKLTPKPNEREGDDHKNQDNPTPVVRTTLTPASPPHDNTICLLKTAVAPVSVGDVKKQANILFDKGAYNALLSQKKWLQNKGHTYYYTEGWTHVSIIRNR